MIQSFIFKDMLYSSKKNIVNDSLWIVIKKSIIILTFCFLRKDIKRILLHHSLQLKKIISYILLNSFVFQIGHSMAIGRVIEKIISEISAFYSEDKESDFFDFVFKDLTCETEQNEEQTQKIWGSDLFCENDDVCECFYGYESNPKSYLTLCAFFPSGFYFSLIQPPD